MIANKRKSFKIIRSLAILFVLYLFLYTNASAASEAEQLLVFVQPGASTVETAFQEHRLPEIRKLAESMGVSVHIVDARQGAPLQISLTPLVVYQNHRGRSIYQGRTTTTARIRNFIRTSRFIPQGEELNRREHIPIWESGRSRIWAPLKVAALTGSRPKNYDHEAFVAAALKNISKGFKRFRMQKVAELDRADRGFYMDFNPWLSPDGSLYISLVLFSQFDCKAPVYQKKITGPWNDRGRLFQEASALMEKEVTQIINNPESGDSFDPIKTDIPQKSWEQIGFPLPPTPAAKTAELTALTRIPTNWVLTKSGPDEPPMIQFRFPAPLDNYTGEVLAAKGELTLPQSLIVSGATGSIEIDTTSSITMGEPRLDEAIRGSIMLFTKKFPTAKFEVVSITSDDQPIAYGRLTPAFVTGTFTLKGKSVPLISKTEFEPVVSEDGNPRLIIGGAFNIDLRAFTIEGADGPAPARYTLLFDVNFILKEKLN
jgi:polyisoprenoid-binding protein YceI